MLQQGDDPFAQRISLPTQTHPKSEHSQVLTQAKSKQNLKLSGPTFLGTARTQQGTGRVQDVPNTSTSFLTVFPSIILWCVTAEVSEAASGSAGITEKPESSAELHCEFSPAASGAILQWDTQLKPQGDHHHLNPVLPSAGWKARISSVFLAASVKAGLQTVPWPNSASCRKELLAPYPAIHVQIYAVLSQARFR